MNDFFNLSEAFAHQTVSPACRAIVIVPARNEERCLPLTLDALRLQVTQNGATLPAECYEVLLLLNNCTDHSEAVANAYAAEWPDFRLLTAHCSLPPEHAHVGTARRMLMDTACERLESVSADEPVQLAILSTDADTIVAPDWIAANLAALAEGAEAVGGVIHLFEEDLMALEPGLRGAYENDRAYQAAVAELESFLDPDHADPWPRHLQHFGASLACTPQVYRRCGGMPAVKPLEDVAFIDALRRVGARLRHAPDVHIQTSARLDGRAEIGLSGQLRHWQDECARNVPHLVQSAAWLHHRFTMLGQLRSFARDPQLKPSLTIPKAWAEHIATLQQEQLAIPAFLERLDCDRLIAETFPGTREEEITVTSQALRSQIELLRGTSMNR